MRGGAGGEVAGCKLRGIFDSWPGLKARLEKAELGSRERGAITAMHSLKWVYRGNVALVGDASGSVDAITGEGLRLALS